MSARSSSDNDDKLEPYLDNLLTGRELSAFEERLRADAALRKEVEAQRAIDRALVGMYTPAHLGEQRARETADRLSRPARSVLPWRSQRWAWVAAAALVLSAVWLGGSPRWRSPHFAPAPLAEVYQRTVRQGFEPYYECDDPHRFAEVFANRQGRALRLLLMPPGSSKLGLSYPGGLSRNTTAMLCRVDEQPVMVFVDRAEADAPAVLGQTGGDPAVHVFREERQGLVFYEVTPFDEPRAIGRLTVE
ncbi:MAG: hypothetical protein KDA37_13625 [Planctomycetales bacterium]|nr:hypothetical protein [Planctomycetales bacterium]